MGVLEKPSKGDKKPWYEWSILIAVIAGVLALSGQFVASLLPILSADTGDFFINVNPMPIEAKPSQHVFLPEDIEDWQKITLGEDVAQANVSVEDINRFIKDYRHPVWLRSTEDRNVTIRFEAPAKEPPFTAKMFVQVNDPTHSIDYAPITIQGIGGDGKKRNCTVYIVYKSPKDLVNEGAVQYEMGRYNKSLELFNKAIEIDNNCSVAWKDKGYVYLVAFNDSEKALDCFNQSINLNRTREALYFKGWTLTQMSNDPGRYDQSIQTYDKAIELDPEYKWAWNGKGASLYYQGKYNESIQAYDKAIEIDPQFWMAWNGKGSAFYHQEKYDEAIQAFDKAIEIKPQIATAWFGKGVALLKQGNLDEAIKSLEEVIVLDPKRADAWYNKGAALLKQGKYDEAIQAFNETIRLEPNNADAWYSKGDALSAQGKYDEAIKAWDEARPHPPFWTDRGFDLLKQGKYDEAIKAFDKAIEIDPQYENAWFGKGDALSAQGKYDEAIKAWDEARPHPPFWIDRGFDLLKQGKYDEAIKAFDKAILIDPQYKWAWFGKGDALSAQGKYDEAIKAFDKAIEIDPQYEKAWYDKGWALKMLNRTTEANATFAKIKELGVSS
jgi:tetratricopeptide (TPR) repeat protein